MTDQISKKILPPGREGIKVLAADLRRAMPHNFTWDFGIILENLSEIPEDSRRKYGTSCGYAGCAIGYAKLFYSNIGPDADERIDIIRYLDMDTYEYGSEGSPGDLIFYRSNEYYPGKLYADITPQDVADALDRYLDETEDQDNQAEDQE